ncbi:MAG: MarR family transcriptional regulator [Micrococcales bacterium]|nr:MarR family transcriptional regulator [Micrococcales bacterium]
MPDRHTLTETEAAVSEHVGHLPLDFAAAHAISSLYRAANAARAHLTTTVLREHDLTWTSFVVLWVVWIWDGMETRHVAESAAISKATLTGVSKTLEQRGWLTRTTGEQDRRLVNLRLTDAGRTLMEELYPKFNAAEAQLITGLSPAAVTEMTTSLRRVVEAAEDTQTG